MQYYYWLYLIYITIIVIGIIVLQVFEGMKAYRCDDGSIQLFRPEENMKRLSVSAERLSLPVSMIQSFLNLQRTNEKV